MTNSFWHCALISIFLGKGKGRASIVWYCIEYTVQLLSIVLKLETDNLLFIFLESDTVATIFFAASFGAVIIQG